MLDTGSLQHSLQHDLVRLFNVRNDLTIEQFLGDRPTALHYGLPDTLGLSPQSASDLATWERVLVRAILLYEPRLSQVQVSVTPDPRKPTLARTRIGAVVTLGQQPCQVDFDVVLDSQSARLAAAAAA